MHFYTNFKYTLSCSEQVKTSRKAKKSLVFEGLNKHQLVSESLRHWHQDTANEAAAQRRDQRLRSHKFVTLLAQADVPKDLARHGQRVFHAREDLSAAVLAVAAVMADGALLTAQTTHKAILQALQRAEADEELMRAVHRGIQFGDVAGTMVTCTGILRLLRGARRARMARARTRCPRTACRTALKGTKGALVLRGAPPASEAVVSLAPAHTQELSRWLRPTPLPHEQLRNLGRQVRRRRWRAARRPTWDGRFSSPQTPPQRTATEEQVLSLVTHNARRLPKNNASIDEWMRHARHRHHGTQALAVLLQETHAQADDIPRLQAAHVAGWGVSRAHDASWSHWSTGDRAAGVAILLNPHAQTQWTPALESAWSPRFFALSTSIDGYSVLLCNVYAPNDAAERDAFFRSWRMLTSLHLGLCSSGVISIALSTPLIVFLQLRHRGGRVPAVCSTSSTVGESKMHFSRPSTTST